MNPLIYNSENLNVNCQVIFSKLKLSYTQVFHLYLCSWNYKFEEFVCRTDTQCHVPSAVLARVREGKQPLPILHPSPKSNAVILSHRHCYDY